MPGRTSDNMPANMSESMSDRVPDKKPECIGDTKNVMNDMSE